MIKNREPIEPQRSPISPSNFERRMLCPGSLAAEKDLPDTHSKAAVEGIMLHDMVNQYLSLPAYFQRSSPYPIYPVDPFWDEDVITEEQKEVVRKAGKYFFTILKENPLSDLFYQWHEKTLDLSFISPGMQGTADSIAIVQSKTSNNFEIHILDYKFGKGVVVDAKYNYQLLLYYLGVINDPEIRCAMLPLKTTSCGEPLRWPTTVHLHIVQPYRQNSVWNLTPEERLGYSNVEIYKEVVEKCYAPDAPRIPSKKGCQFCKAKPTCPELAGAIPNINLKIDQLSDIEISEIYDNKELINIYLQAVETHIKTKIEEGGSSFSDYSLRPKRSNRKWTDEASEYLSEALGEAAWDINKKLITITQAEKLLEKDVIAKLTMREEGQNEIVKLSRISTQLLKDLNND